MLPEEEQIAAEIILQHFFPEEIPQEHERLKTIRKLLIDKINFLLDHDFEKLLWILYRIDVSEEKARSALAGDSGRTPSEVLADLMIERQLKKAETRLKFRAPHDGNHAG